MIQTGSGFSGFSFYAYYLLFHYFPMKNYLRPAYQKRSKLIIYSKYLQGTWWHFRRWLQVRILERECQICKAKKYLEPHHLSYEHLHQERPHELVTLCHICHKSMHLGSRYEVCGGVQFWNINIINYFRVGYNVEPLILKAWLCRRILAYYLITKGDFGIGDINKVEALVNHVIFDVVAALERRKMKKMINDTCKHVYQFYEGL